MSHSHFNRTLYVTLGNLKRQGHKKIEIRTLMKQIGIEKENPDTIFFIVRKVIEQGHEVKIHGRKEN
jgi:hypothetical protein